MPTDTRSKLLTSGAFRPDQVTANVFGAFSFPDQIEKYRQETWNRFQDSHPKAFDGSLVRLHSVIVSDGHIDLRFQRTAFSAYVTSRDPGFEGRFPNASRADPMGITIVALSNDGHVLVTKRALDAEQNPGALYFVGGYADAQDEDGPIDLFAEAERELREETGEVEVDRSASLLLGIGYDPHYCHPEATVMLVLNIPGHEMLRHVGKAKDAREAHSFHLVTLESVVDDSAVKELGGPATWSFRQSSALLRKVAPLLLGNCG